MRTWTLTLAGHCVPLAAFMAFSGVAHAQDAAPAPEAVVPGLVSFGEGGQLIMPCDEPVSDMRGDLEVFACGVGPDIDIVVTYITAQDEPVPGRPPGGENFNAMAASIAEDSGTTSYEEQEIAGRPSFATGGQTGGGEAAIVAVDDGDRFLVIMTMGEPGGAEGVPLARAQAVAASVEFAEPDESE